MKTTRRAILLAPALSAAQTPSQPISQAPPPATIEQARATLQANREAMARVKVPADTEPAFTFKP